MIVFVGIDAATSLKKRESLYKLWALIMSILDNCAGSLLSS